MNDLAPDLPLPDSAPTPDSISQPRAFDLSQPEPRERRPFSDLTLFIPGMTTPVQGFDGGINLAALDNHREKGLLCLLDPYQEMNELDFIELFCRDTLVPVGTHTVSWTEAEKGLQIPFYIPRTRLPDGSVEPVFFKVTRVTGGNPEETRRFKLKVDTVRPGGRNPVASTFQNENLAKPIFPRDLIDFGVGEGDIGTPVPVTIDFYPVENLPANTHRAPRDRIRLSIGGVIIEHRVTDGEGAPNNRDPIDVMVNTGDWKKVGSGSHVCEYEVIDEVGNYSDGWSPAQILEVRLDDDAEPLLPEAYVEESDEHDVLDADALDGDDATIIIAVHRHDGYLPGDILRVKVAGRTMDGVAVTRYYEHEVTIVGRVARVPWPFADLQLLINGRAQITYERIRAGVPNRHSHNLLVGVIGTGGGSDLLAPFVHDAPGNILPPDVQYLTVDVLPYLGQDPNDRVTLILEGTRANGSSYYRELVERAGSYDKEVTFRLLNGPNGEIAQLEGGTLRLYYQVTNAEGTRTSDDIDLDVGDPVASLPEPLLEEAPPPDYVFDPVLSPFDLKVWVRKHPDIQPGDTVTLHFEGTAAGGSITLPFDVTEFWKDQDIPFTVPRQYVIANLDRSASVYYTVERENSRRRLSHAVPLRVGTALDLPVAYIYQSDVTGPDTATINPMHVISPAVVSVRVQYDDMKASDDIKLYWIGTPGLGTPDIPAKPGAATGDQVTFNLPSTNSAVAANIGQSPKVYYEVTRGGRTTKSGELTVTVMKFDEIPGDNPLDGLVSIPEASNGMINTGLAHRVLVKAWPFKRQGQAMWIYLRGTSDLTLRDGVPVSSADANRDIEHNIPGSYLSGLTDRSPLTVEVLVSLDGSNSIDTAVRFTVPTYTISKVIGVIEVIRVGTAPRAVVLHPNGLRAYVTNEKSNSISVIDTTTHTLIRTINGIVSPWGLAIHPDGSRLYVSSHNTATTGNAIEIINTDDYSITPMLNSKTDMHGLAIKLDGSILYAATVSGSIYALRTTPPYTRVATMTLDGVIDLALNKDGTRLYAVNDRSPGSFGLINTTTNQVISKHGPLAGLGFSIACDPHHDRVYISSRGRSVAIFSTIDNREIKNLILDGPNFTIAFNPVREEAYVTQGSPNSSLCVIDTSKGESLSRITGFNNPMGVAVSADGIRAYVTNYTGNTLSVVAL